MSILDKITQTKLREVTLNQSLKPIKLLEQSIYFETPVVSMTAYLQREDKAGIIAEIKRASPSAGTLNAQLNVEKLSVGYMKAGATALSVLTDHTYFKGSDQDLTIARKFNYCPILRKDFILNDYQLVEAKSIGADCILLIAACLEPEKCKQLAETARSLGLEVLLEVHNAREIETHLNEYIDLVGVNNRDLHTFNTDINTSVELARHIPEGFVRISESGITDPLQLKQLREVGYQGFLIGGHFMKHPRPSEACRMFVNKIGEVAL